MLSSGASNVSRRPQRSKSTPSFKPRAVDSSESNRDDSDPLHQDALTAANLAYERAKERTTVEKGVTRGGRGEDPNKASDGKPELGRRQSVRFVGPNAVTTRTRSITRREEPTYRASHESHRQSLPPRLADTSLLSNEDSVTALPEGSGEFYVASEPSSYRRLRKAKSMFSPGKAPSAVFANRTPNGKQHFQRRSLHSSVATGEPIRVPDPRLKRSYSFLRGGTDSLSTANHQYATQDAAIQLARDTYIRQVEQQRLKEQPSFLHLGRRAKAQRAFRRTVRTSSTNSYGSAISSPLSSVELKRPAGVGSKARTLSQTWKEKLRRVFKRSSTDHSIPVQHLDATHIYYGDHTPKFQHSSQRFPSLPEPNAELLRRIGSRESTLHSEPMAVSKSPCSNSIRSLGSDEDDINKRSRVTSWTNSTAADTINIPNFVERKRLSIIREDGGPHQSSSKRVDDLDSGYATFRQPVKQGGAGKVEMKRIFSALQREIHQNNRDVTFGDSDSDANSELDRQRKHQPLSIPGRRTSNWQGVRRVNTATEDMSRDRGSKVSSSVVAKCLIETNADHGLQQVMTKGPRSRYQLGDEGMQENLTPQEIANMNESNVSAPKRPLHEVRSAFFPASMRIERSNMSPFRRARYAGSEDEDAAIRSEFADQRAIIGSRIRSGSVARSESVYSRSSSDPMSKAAASSLSLAGTERSDKAGTAVILTSRSLMQEPSARPFFPQRYSSANRSGDWKKFLASEVAYLEKSGRPHGLEGEGFSVKERGHRKESAQLDGDDTMIGTLRAPDIVPKQPLGIIQGNVIERPRSIAETVPLITHHPAKGMNGQNENAPVAPYSVSTQKRFKTGNGVLASGSLKSTPTVLRQRPSQASLNSQNDSNKVSATQSRRVSPERAERLRRLKSSSSATLRLTPFGNKNQAVNNTTEKLGHESEDSDASPIAMDTHAGKNHKLVDSFLKERRSQMRISEESAAEPVFL